MARENVIACAFLLLCVAIASAHLGGDRHGPFHHHMTATSLYPAHVEASLATKDLDCGTCTLIVDTLAKTSQDPPSLEWLINTFAKGCDVFFPNGMSSCAVLCCAVLCCAVLCCAVLCCAVLCCAVLCCAVLCCAVLCCAVLCCVVLCVCVCVCVYISAISRVMIFLQRSRVCSLSNCIARSQQG